MTRKYKYLLRFGHGRKTFDLLGPSISYFWNDIYDVFDLHREMLVEKLDDKVFSSSEIKRVFRELSEDMEEDSAEIWLEIQNKGKRLRFLEINILPGFSLDEQQELLKEYLPALEPSQFILSTNECRMLHFVEEKILVLLVALEDPENKAIDAEKVNLLLVKGMEHSAKRMILVTWNDINDEARRLVAKSKVELLDTGRMLREINERNLGFALDEFELDVTEGIEERFTSSRFQIYLDLVKSATSNVAKKNTLERLAECFFSGVAGLRVVKRDYRGPSEEFDLLVANESDDALLKTIGNPVAIECRHRRKPASSKDIRDFRGKLEDSGLRAGMMITLKGITGDRYDAVTVIREARKCGMSILVIALEDLNQIVKGRKPIDVIRECFYKYV